MNNEQAESLVAKPLKVVDLVNYQDGSVVSRVLLKQKTGNVSLFAFDAGQELSEHTSTARLQATARVRANTSANHRKSRAEEDFDHHLRDAGAS